MNAYGKEARRIRRRFDTRVKRALQETPVRNASR